MADVPAGIVPVFIPEKSLLKYGMKLSDDVGDSAEQHWFITEQIKAEIAAVGFMCDFHGIRKHVDKWTEEKMLVVRDDDQKFGENYFWCNSLETVAQYGKHVPAAIGDGTSTDRTDSVEDEETRRARQEEEERKKLEEEKLLTYVPKPLVARPWQSLGSEAEVDGLVPHSRRPPIRMLIQRKRRAFGRKRELIDMDEKERSYIGCNRQIDKNYDLRKIQLDSAFQTTVPAVDGSTQTTRYRLVNKAITYEAQTMAPAKREATMASEAMLKFMKSDVVELLGVAIQHNCTFNVFENDFDCLPVEDISLGQKDANVKFFNTFVDLRYSKNKRITGVNWLPHEHGIIGVSIAENITRDKRLDLSGKARSASVLLWNFNDLIHPELVLVAPDEVCCFAFNPDNPNIIVAGLMNGQVCLWNTSDVRYLRQRSERGSVVLSASFDEAAPLPEQSESVSATAGTSTAKPKLNEPGLASSTSSHTPSIGPVLLSYIERSHSQPVTDIVFLPRQREVNKRGVLFDSPHSRYPLHFMTLAGDGKLLFWDIRGDTSLLASDSISDSALHLPTQSNVPFDSKWTPMLSKDLTIQGNVVSATKMIRGTETAAYFVTDRGALALGHWASNNADEDESMTEKGLNTIQAISNIGHCLAGQSIDVSPHFNDLLLSTGDWTFCIWKLESVEHGPVFRSPMASSMVTHGCWSPSRPGVIVLAKADGTIDVWDFCDQSHQPVMVDLTISSSELTCMQFLPEQVGIGDFPGSSLNQYLAIGDSGGNLHITELPDNLRRPLANEKKMMAAFYERELHRAGYLTHLNLPPHSGEGESHQSLSEETVATDPTVDDQAQEEAYQQLLIKFKRQLIDGN